MISPRLDDPSWGAGASRALVAGIDARNAKAQRKIYGTKRPVSAGTVLRGAPRDEPWTVEKTMHFSADKTPAKSASPGSQSPHSTSPSSSKPRPATARDPVGPWARGVATTSARRTPGRGGTAGDDDDDDGSPSKRAPPPR